MRLLWRHFTASPAASLLVGLVVFVVVALVAIAPRALAAMATAELQHRIDEVALELRDLTAEGVGAPITLPFPALNDAGSAEEAEALAAEWFALGLDELYAPMTAGLQQIRSEQAPVLRDALGEPDFTSRSETIPTNADVAERDAPISLSQIAFDPLIEQRVRIVEGAFPPPISLQDTVLPVMLSVRSAEEMRWSVGEERDRAGERVLLTGTFEAVDPDAPYWRHAASVLSPFVFDDGNSTPRVTGVAYVNPHTPHFGDVRGLRTTAWFPLDVDALDFADASALAPELRTFTDAAHLIPGVDGALGLSLTFDSRAVPVIDAVLGRAAATTSVLAMVASGPLGVVLAVFALGARSVVERRRQALSLAAARGASGWQLRGAMALEGALIGVLPAAAGIMLAAVLLPERVGLDALIAPALLGIAPAVLFAAAASPSGLRATRADLGGSAGRFRWILEAVVVGLAALAVFLLLRRGLTTSSGTGVDPLLAATPLLLSLAACVGVLRFYPLPLRALAASLRRRSGLVGFLGATRALRDRSLALAAVLALVVGVSVAVFSSVLLTTLDRGVESGAASAVGADLRAEGPVFEPTTVDAASTLSGVQAVSGVDLAGPVALRIDKVRENVQLFVVDSATLDAFRELPAGLGERDGDAIPVVLSSDIAEQLDPDAELLLEGLPVTEAAVADRTTGYGATTGWVMVDRAFAEELTGNRYLPRLLLIDTAAGVDAAALATELTELGGPSTRITSLDQAIAEARSAPTTAGLRSALLLAVVAIALLAALAVVLSSAIGAASRNRILGLLRTVGLSGRQASALVAWELAPPAVVAILVGTLLGLALPWAVTAAVDLRPFTGGASQPEPAVDALLIALVLGGLLLAVIAAAATAILLARRASPATTLRMGAD